MLRITLETLKISVVTLIMNSIGDIHNCFLLIVEGMITVII